MAAHVGKPFRQWALASAVLPVNWAGSSGLAQDVPAAAGGQFLHRHSACSNRRHRLSKRSRRFSELPSPGRLCLDHGITLRDEEVLQSALPLIIDPWSDDSVGNSHPTTLGHYNGVSPSSHPKWHGPGGSPCP
jgi:hypothetical protein